MKGEAILLRSFFQALRTYFYFFQKKFQRNAWKFLHSNASPLKYLSINLWVTGKKKQ